MIFEIIIIVAIAVIFVILVRKMPEEKMDEGASWLAKISRWIKLPKFKKLQFRLGKFGLKSTQQSSPAPAITKDEKIAAADRLLKNNQIEQAEKIYLKLAAKYPQEARIYNRLGVIYLKQKNYSDARDSFLQAIKIDPTESSRHYNLGMAYFGMNLPEKAKVSLKKALELDPGKEKYEQMIERLEKK